MPPRGSLKRRLQADEGPPELVESNSEPEPSQASTTKFRGGVRQRMQRESIDTSAGASSAVPSLPTSSSASSSSSSLPLNSLLKKKRRLGKATSPEVQEYAMAAEQQGPT